MHRLCIALSCLFLVMTSAVAAQAQDEESAPAPYAKWTADATVQPGLFTLWRKNDHVYVEIAKAQLGQDFIQSAAPSNGLGGWGIVWGEAMLAQTKIIEFTRNGDKILITWPNTFFKAPEGSARQRSIDQSFSPSVVAAAPIVAEDTVAGKIVFDAAPFLGDVLGLTQVLRQALGTTPENDYHLDPARTVFGPSKAFPLNVIIDADQTWETENPNVVDTLPDARTLQLRIVYNLAQPPNDQDYMPRIYDDRLGYVASPYLDFSNDLALTRNVNYILRWNLQPSDPTKPISPAKKPVVFYLSNTIPDEYRATIRAALLQWNKAFVKVGISDAIEVQDQPNDPSWDPDDIRYNVVRWVTEAYPSFGAEAQWVYDPRTGELFHSGILIDAVVAYNSTPTWEYFITPTRTSSGRLTLPQFGYGAEAAAEGTFGNIALNLMGRDQGAGDQWQYRTDLLTSVVLHESGHDMGFQHNFISSQAYTAAELQNKAFTSRMGVATSVMGYAPTNLWPKPKGQGSYFQTTIGPYDYYAIHWGYARIPGARTPQDELPTLRRWAAAGWTNPLTRFASDEDVSYFNAHAVDPRVSQFELTNDSLGWCTTQFDLTQHLMHDVDQRWPRPGHSAEESYDAFGWLLVHYTRICPPIAEHFIGGEYLSRSHKGDPGAAAPLQPVARADEQRAFGLLDKYIFSESAWNYSPALLNSFTYQEQAPVWGGNWAYNPPQRHDIPISTIALQQQVILLETMFQPNMLQRLDDLAMKSKPGQTMSLADLFDWSQQSIFGDLRSKHYAPTEIRRNLQQWYTRYLINLWLKPDPGTPYDAQSLARLKLLAEQSDVRYASRSSNLDELTRAHLDNLDVMISRALDTRNVVPFTSM
jgi:Met-zincin/Domain of unknown function (DUF5117)/Domain of unknown function (DUF5118)